MTTLNLQVGASTDDCWAANSSTTPEGLTTNVISVVGQGSTTGAAGFRFANVTIPQGTTLTSATLTLKAQASYSTGSAIIGRVACEAADNAATFAATNQNMSTAGNRRPRTTYSTDWNLQSVTAESDYSKVITAQVQAVINRVGWVSGNAIVVLIDDNGSAVSEWQDFYSYDNTPAKAAKLDIVYGAATATGDATTSVSIGLTAAGVVAVAGASTQTVTIGSSAAGGVAIVGASTQAISVGLTAAGVVASGEATGDASTAIAVGLSAAGVVTIAATSSQPVTIGLTAAGSVALAAASTQAVSVGLSAAGAVALVGVTSTAVSVGLSADGITTTYKNPNVQVGEGYTDVSRQLVRTSDNRVYLVATNCDSYPCTSLTQTVRVFRADQTGIPTTFTRKDSANEPAAAGAVAVAIDANDDLHIVWHNRSSNDAVKYAVFDTATDTWGTVETPDADLGAPSDSGQGDMLVGLSLDADSVPHIVYLKKDGTRNRVNYRNRVGGTWSDATIVDDQAFGSNERCWHPSIAHDYEGRIAVAWLIGTFNDIADGTIYIRTRESGGTWNTTAAVSPADDALTGIDQSASLFVTEDNRYHVAYMAASTTPGLKYIRYYYSDNDGATWAANAPGSGTQATHNPSIGPNGRGGLRIWGHGTPDGANHGQNVYYFDGAGGAGTWSAWTQFVTGTNYDSSVSTRWQRYHYSNAGYVDIAYWNDNYANVLYYGGEHVTQAAATSAVTVGNSASGAVAVVAEASQAVTVGLTADGTVITGTVANATTDVIVSLTAAGVVTVAAESTLPITLGLSAAGVVGVSADASSGVTIGLSASGSVAIVADSSQAVTVSLLATALTVQIEGVITVAATGQAPAISVTAQQPTITAEV
jgi:hypothetical protein